MGKTFAAALRDRKLRLPATLSIPRHGRASLLIDGGRCVVRTRSRRASLVILVAARGLAGEQVFAVALYRYAV